MESKATPLCGVVVYSLSPLGERVGGQLMCGRGGKGLHGTVERVRLHYGVVGYGLVSPLPIGAPIGMAVRNALGMLA